MKWEEVRRIYPDQFVKLKILDYHIVENVKIVYDIVIDEISKLIRDLRNYGNATSVYIPKENIRFKTQGAGANFVHGGASMQE